MIELIFGMSIPAVETHDVVLELVDVQAICEQRVEEAELPCVVVTMDEKVCFAFLDERGESSTVHCFWESKNGNDI